jgi:hypothetical protein
MRALMVAWRCARRQAEWLRAESRVASAEGEQPEVARVLEGLWARGVLFLEWLERAAWVRAAGPVLRGRVVWVQLG